MHRRRDRAVERDGECDDWSIEAVMASKAALWRRPVSISTLTAAELRKENRGDSGIGKELAAFQPSIGV